MSELVKTTAANLPRRANKSCPTVWLQWRNLGQRAAMGLSGDSFGSPVLGWFPGVEVIHSVQEHFGPAEYVRIKKTGERRAFTLITTVDLGISIRLGVTYLSSDNG